MFEARVLIVVGVMIALAGGGFALALDDPLPLVLGGLFGVCYVLCGMFCHMITERERDR